MTTYVDNLLSFISDNSKSNLLNETQLKDIQTMVESPIDKQELIDFQKMLINGSLKVQNSRLFKMFVPSSTNKNLKPKISAIDQEGIVTIDFGGEIKVPKSAFNFTNAVFSLGIVDENFMRMLAYTNSNRSNEKPSNTSDVNNYT